MQKRNYWLSFTEGRKCNNTVPTLMRPHAPTKPQLDWSLILFQEFDEFGKLSSYCLVRAPRHSILVITKPIRVIR